MDYKKIVLLLLFAPIFCLSSVKSDVTQDRINSVLDDYIKDPWPDPSSTDIGSAMWGKGAYAVAALYREKDIPKAEQYINYICDYEDITNVGLSFPFYFSMHALWRAYMDPELSEHLSQATKDNVEQTMWQWVYKRSNLADAQASVWNIVDSENHDIIQKSSYLLCLQALRDAGAPYGGSANLFNGGTVNDHLAAWKKYFYEYFRQRAREGINCEIASLTYAKYTLECYMNIYDLTEDDDLAYIAEDLLNLYWAEVAGDFMPSTGLRGGAGTRWYKDDLCIGDDGTAAMAYVYDWYDVVQPPHPVEVVMLTSSYRNPAIINKAGSRIKRTPYMQTSRKFGKGVVVDNVSDVSWDSDFRSHIRRDVYWHNDYVIGAISLKTDSNAYIQLIDQNRAMGVMFAADIDDRIIFHGKGTDQDGRTGYAEITGVCRTNCFVGARDRIANQSDGTLIFLSDGELVRNKVDDTGWIFTKTGPYSAEGRKFVADENGDDPTRNHELLDGNNATGWTNTEPVIAGNGQSGNCLDFDGSDDVAFGTKGWQSYGSVTADFYFKADTTGTSTRYLIGSPSTWEVTVVGNNLTFTIWTDSTPSTRALTYSNAFVAGTWYHVVASITANGSSSIMSLTVNGVNAAGSPSTGIKMRTASGDLTLGNKPSYSRFFNGKIDTVRISIPSQSNKRIAAWDMESLYRRDVFVGIKIANGGYEYNDVVRGRMIELDAPNNDMWSPVVIQVGSASDYANFDEFKTSVKANTCTYSDGKLTYVSEAGDTIEYWSRSGNLPKINGESVNLNPAKSYSSPYLDMDHGSDTARIMCPGETTLLTLDFNYGSSPRWDDYQTLALWHMDNLVSSKVPDDDLENAGRNKDLTLSGGAALTTGDGGKFDEALNFDGVDDYAYFTNGWTNCTHVKVDFWMYPTDDNAGSNVVVSARNVWSVDVSSGKLSFTTWNSNLYAGSLAFTTNLGVNQWHRVIATCDASGNRTLTCDGVTISDNVGAGLVTSSNNLELGNKNTFSRYYQGKLDDVKITKFSFDISLNLKMPDLAIFSSAWMSQLGDAHYNSACDLSIPKDNAVNLSDLIVFSSRWLQ